MKYITVLISSIAMIASLSGQNLIVNGGFENIAPCPSNQGQLNFANPWYSARGTCDLYNTCATNVNFSVPNNQVGTQAARTGNGYSGFFATQGYIETREYLSAPLLSPLIAGKTYCLSFWVSLADDVDTGSGDTIFDVAVNDIAAYISTSSVTPNPNNFNHLTFAPQVVNPSANILRDRVHWQNITGSFIASGGEKFITIGSFSSQANQDTTWLDYWNSNNWAYYYVDDVSLFDCSANPMSINLSGITTICNGDSSVINATISGGISPFTYFWSPSVGLNSTNMSSVVSSNSITTIYTLTVSDANTNSISQQFTLTVVPNPNANAGVDTTICENTSVLLNATGGGTYIWNNSITTSTNQVSPMLNSQYIVTVTVNGCVDTDTVNVMIKNCTADTIVSIPIIVPNVVTANNDGVNDYFKITGLESYPNSSIKVFNRWGTEVYSNANYQNDWKPDLTDGTYFYIINVSDGRYFNGFLSVFK
jgi:gliding motility-associated-like protein